MTPLLKELETAGVFNRDADGTIFSRRMRGGNPSLLNRMDKQEVKQEVNPLVKGGHEKLRKQKPTPPSSSSSSKNTYTLEFLAFYDAYPTKKAKARAFKAWQQLKPMNGIVEEIMSAPQKHKQSTDWQKDNGKYIPFPAKWLNERRWEDELQEKVKDGRSLARR